MTAPARVSIVVPRLAGVIALVLSISACRSTPPAPPASLVLGTDYSTIPLELQLRFHPEGTPGAGDAALAPGKDQAGTASAPGLEAATREAFVRMQLFNRVFVGDGHQGVDVILEFSTRHTHDDLAECSGFLESINGEPIGKFRFEYKAGKDDNSFFQSLARQVLEYDSQLRALPNATPPAPDDNSGQ